MNINSNFINTQAYLDHKLYSPGFSSFQFNQYLPDKISIPFTFGNFKRIDVKRISLLALPFVALDAFAGKILGLAMHGIKCLTNVSNLTKKNVSFFKSLQYSGNIALSVIAITALFFSFKIGLLITTAIELGTNLYQCVIHIKDKKFLDAGMDLLGAISSAAYGAILCFGSLEFIIASLAIKGTVALIASGKELIQGRYPEFFAKFAMSMIRFNGSVKQIENLKTRNFLNSLQKYQVLLERIKKSRKIESLYHHPLIYLHHKVENGKVVFFDDNGKTYDFGSHFSLLGKGLVKGMNLAIKEDSDGMEITFKLNQPARENLSETMEELRKLASKPEELNSFLKLNQSKIENIDLNVEEILVSWWEMTKLATIQLGDKATIKIHCGKEYINSYETVSIKLFNRKNLYDLHEALSMLGIEEAIAESTQADITRMKLGYLFRTFCPKEALNLERSHAFFDKDINEVRQIMIDSNKGMEEVLDRYEGKLTMRDLLPGRKRVHIDGLSDDLQKIASHHLTAMITGHNHNSISTLSSILQMGLLSNEARNYSGITEKGLKGSYDHVGGDTEVYTQLVTSNRQDYNSLMYSWYGNIRLIIDPKVLESCTYQYHADLWGNKIVENESHNWLSSYQNRPNITDFVEREHYDPTFDHEVMVKDRIDPKYITGIVVDSEYQKTEIISYMKDHGHYENGKLFGRNIDIQVGTKINWNK